jgi:hypothetical protein
MRLTDQQRAEKTQPPAEALDTELVRRLALAISRRGGDALLIDPNNLPAGHMPILEAARSGHCFAVLPADEVLSLDVDQSRAARYLLNELLPELERRNLRAVVWNSGTIGHLHLLARISDPALKAAIEGAARLHGCDVRAGQRIRPPLSRHRLDYRVSLVYPKTVGEALAVLAPAREPQRLSQSPAINSEPGLSAQMLLLLREGDREGKYLSRSEVIQALALASVNAGLSEAWLAEVLLDVRNRAGEKVRQILAEKSERAARQYVHRSYEKARARFVQIPPFRDRSDVLAAIDEIEHAADAMTRRGGAGATDRAVLQAHMIIARRVCRLNYGAAVREVAELSGVASLGTVSVSHRRLVTDGWLFVLQPSTRKAPTRYLLRLPKGTQPNTHITGGGVRSNVRLTSALTPVAEAWRWGALGLTKWRVWRALGGQTVRQLSEQMRIGRRAVRAHLSCLTAWGLAERDSGGRWHRIEGDLGRIAQALGTAGEASRQHQRHRRDREFRKLMLEIRRRTGAQIDQRMRITPALPASKHVGQAAEHVRKLGIGVGTELHHIELRRALNMGAKQ